MNPEHLSALKSGPEALAALRAESKSELRLDFSDADLMGLNLSVFDAIENADFQRAKLRGANFSGCKINNVNLGGADLDGSCFEDCQISHAILDNCNLNHAVLRHAYIGHSRFVDASLDSVVASSVHIESTNFSRSDLCRGNFTSAILQDVKFEGCQLGHANLRGVKAQRCSLVGGDIREADLEAAVLADLYVKDIYGASYAKSLEKTIIETPVDGLDSLHLPFCDRYLDWEKLRSIGQIRLFGVSYAVLVSIPAVFFLLAVYNEHIVSARRWAELARDHEDRALAALSSVVTTHLHPQPLPRLSLVLLISTVMLAVASTLFLFGCHARVKESTLEYWQTRMQQSPVHYWAFAWQRRKVRIVCALCYAVGGIGVLTVLVQKIWWAAQFTLQHSFF